MTKHAATKHTDTLKFGAGLPSHHQVFDPFELYKPAPAGKFDMVYDMRQTPWLTSVKTQSADGCWAYATMGSIESRWLKLGSQAFDLSDNNMKYCHQYIPERSYWGNHWMATSYLVRGAGPFTESQDPYPGGTPGPGQCLQGLVPVSYVPEARYLPKNMNLMKQTVLDYGAVTSMMYISNTYYNPVNFTYYYPGSSINHVVCIVGWNDTLQTAGGTGAWICKNSYGPGWGQGGYFYVSYNDGAFERYNSYWPVRWDYDELATIYQHDLIGGYDGVGWGDSLCYALVKFQAETDLEILHIGSFVLNSGMKVEYKVFDNLDGAPTGLLGQKNWTAFDLPGYYTTALDSGIRINAGNEFYVVAGFNSRTLSNKWPIPIEDTIDGYAQPIIETGKCWINPNFNLYPSYWFPLGADKPGWEFDICLKLYTKPLNRITGLTRYNDTFSNPLQEQVVQLFNGEWNEMENTLTDDGGVFEFSMLSQGSYFVDALISYPTGGYNATDALLAQLHSISMPGFVLSGLPFQAADVNDDGVVNATDALYILQRTVELIPAFPAGDWQTKPDTLEIHGSDLSAEIPAQCTGDINSSYFTNAGYKSQLIVSDNMVIEYSLQEEILLPVIVQEDTDIGAYTIFFKAPAGELTIENIEAVTGQVMWNCRNDLLRIAGIISGHYSFKQGDTLFTIRLRVKNSSLSNPLNPVSIELANAQSQPVASDLWIPSLKVLDAAIDQSNIHIVPNPSAEGIFEITSSNSLKNSVAEVFNPFGEKIRIKNYHEGEPFMVDLSSLAKGIYFVRITTLCGNREISFVEKLVYH